MEANGAGSVDLGGTTGGSAGFNPAAMMASMAVGSVVGQNIAGAMNTSMTATNNQTPPPIPVRKILYNVVIDGKSEGPFDVDTLAQMAQAGQIRKDTLVWKPGMSEWQPLSTVPELTVVEKNIPPEIVS